jgi:hypothetical protein
MRARGLPARTEAPVNKHHTFMIFFVLPSFNVVNLPKSFFTDGNFTEAQ